MQDVFAILKPADYAFLVGLLEGHLDLDPTRGPRLRAALAAYEADGAAGARADLDALLEREIRYLGSADLAYWARRVVGAEPGVPFRAITNDVARALKVGTLHLGPHREMLEELVEIYATDQFAALSPEEQQRMLEELGVDTDEAAAFLLKSAGVFSVPLLIRAFDAVIVQGLIKHIIFGTIARLIGSRLAGRLFGMLMARLPWWVSWIGPAAWTLSIGWTVLDLQGPARRKTIPVVLYLGVCSLRERGEG